MADAVAALREHERARLDQLVAEGDDALGRRDAIAVVEAREARRETRRRVDEECSAAEFRHDGLTAADIERRLYGGHL